MKKITFLIVSMFGLFGFAQAQIQTPAPSPGAKIEQHVGLIDISVEYSRPSVKGRKIFGDLVPFDKVWRTGANSATKITFSGDVNFGGADVKAGSYALLTIPGSKNWSVLLYPYTNGDWSGYGDSGVEPVKVMAEAMTLPHGHTMQSLMLGFDDLTNSSVNFFIVWDNVDVTVPIKLNTADAVEASISKVMAGPTAGDYYSAASYYWSEKKNLPQALEWVNKSVAMGNEKFWVLRTKSLIQAELGDKKGAIASAERSLELAREAKSDDYIKMNTESIAEWKKG